MEYIADPGTTLFVLILVVGGLVFYNLKIKYLQELARIEHGLTTLPKPPNRLKKMGIVAISIGLGILLGYFIGKFAGLPMVVSISSMILIIGGAGLIVVNRMQ